MAKTFGLHKSVIKTSYIGLAIKILAKKKRPMSVVELTNEILKHKKVKGKTPEKTLSGILQRTPYFKRTSKGYVLVKAPNWMNL